MYYNAGVCVTYSAGAIIYTLYMGCRTQSRIPKTIIPSILCWCGPAQYIPRRPPTPSIFMCKDATDDPPTPVVRGGP